MQHRSWHVREGSTRVLLQAMLTCGESCITNISNTVKTLAKLLNDKHPKVRYAAIEAFAVLQSLNLKGPGIMERIIDTRVKLDHPVDEQLKVCNIFLLLWECVYV